MSVMRVILMCYARAREEGLRKYKSPVKRGQLTGAGCGLSGSPRIREAGQQPPWRLRLPLVWIHAGGMSPRASIS